jgi:hypothetical protein
MNLSFNSNFLPRDKIISLDPSYIGEIRFFLEDKGPSSFSLVAQNRTSLALNEILNSLSARKIFRFKNELGTEKISDVAHAIFERYETRYQESYWQSIVDTFKSCFCIETDLQKMKNLLDLILSHPDVKVDDDFSSSEEETVRMSFKKMTDPEIIHNLVLQNYSKPIEKGGDGRCLFLSIASQITEEDIDNVFPRRLSFCDWSKLSLGGQADELRKLAMARETIFFDTLPLNVLDLTQDELVWVRELYKDMLQELNKMSSSNSDHMQLLHKMITENSDELKLEYFKKNFLDYRKKTSQQFNWAGTSELIALSRVFNRETVAYGQDYASSDRMRIDKNGNVLPYHHRMFGRTPAIVVFQCNGGGHYKMLKLPEEKINS